VADELLGAAKLLAELSRAAGNTNAVEALTPDEQARAGLQRDLRRFSETHATLSPEQAAAQWLTLYDRARSLPPSPGGEDMDMMMIDAAEGDDASSGPVSLRTVVAAIPPPTVWPALEKAVEARTVAPDNLGEAALKLCMYYLNDSTNKLRGEMAAIDALLKKMDTRQRQMATYQVRQLRRVARAKLGVEGAAAVTAELEAALEAQEGAEGNRVVLQLPDLVGLLGEKPAQELIDRALETPGVLVKADEGGATLRLAQSRCLKKIADLKTPQWGLVASPDDVDLYEALAAKFPAAAKHQVEEEEDMSPSDLVRVNVMRSYESDSERTEARRFYVLGLIARQRVDDAVRVVTEASAAAGEQMEFLPGYMMRRAPGRVPPAALYTFYQRLLTETPGLRLWSELVAVAPMAGKTDEALALLVATEARPDLTPEQRTFLRKSRADALLALDRVDEGVALLQAMVKDAESTNATAQVAGARIELCRRLAVLGRLLDRPAVAEEGLAAMAAMIARCGAHPTLRNYSSSYETMYRDELIAGKRYAAAEQAILKAMQEALTRKPTREELMYGGGMEADGRLRTQLGELANVYAEAGRDADVVALLEKAPWWGVSDLVELEAAGVSCDGRDLTAAAAKGLHALGRDAEAVAMLKDRVARGHLSDEGYRLLADIVGPDLIPWLDEMYARDRFEERPLIWKAYALMKAGQLEEAEKAAREALRVDPTDGETPEGDRVRGYAVLADILEALGKKDDAAFFRKVVESVRLAEEGDRLTEAGLIQRSLAAYDKAELSFADAYCVQWRLAERLQALGDTEGAEKHYRIAFERMPEQFGQVASFCFGCAGVFDGEQSRSVAENVLLRLEKSGPPRPQVYYLLGQLREAQQRPGDAYACYRQAVAIDPDYLDVWGKLDGVAERAMVPRAERNAIRLKILSLDPLQRHSGADAKKITDMRGLWMTLEKAQFPAVALTEHLLTLPASRDKLQENVRGQSAAMAQMERMQYRMWSRMGQGYRPQRPGEAVAASEFIAAALQMSQQAQMMSAQNAFFDE
jgi:tetratricopeptide (TPR) repeat protein